jgi:hypothetical protein
MPEAKASQDRLVKYGRMLRSGDLRDAIQAMIGVRNTFVAHFDMQPNPRHRKALIRDLDHVISAASVVIGEANVYVLGREIDTEELRKILRKDAEGFVGTLKRGFRK